ncbi:hypothetical protein JZU51_00630, partial [bacterium]|nr:hypothetical protein [bacterium]
DVKTDVGVFVLVGVAVGVGVNVAVGVGVDVDGNGVGVGVGAPLPGWNSYAPRSSYVRTPAPVFATDGSSTRALPSISKSGSLEAFEFAISIAGDPAPM